MKILHLTTHLNRGGISNYILSVGAALHQKGHKVFVVSSGGEMQKEFEECGIRLKTMPIRTKSELSWRIYAALPELLRWIRKEKIDLLHAHTRITQVIAFLIGLIQGTPSVTTCHGFYKRRLGRRLLPCWGKRAVAISDPVADHLRDTFGLPPERIRVVYNGVDLQTLRNRFLKHDPVVVKRDYGFPEESYVLGVTARLVPDKGHEFLIRAVKDLESEFPNLCLLIVGDGRHRQYLEGLTRHQGLMERVYFTGNLRDVSFPLRAMDIFVLPAVWREGFGLSIVEAMACEIPVIVTNIWALNSLIQNGVNGVLVEPRNVGELAEGIRKMLRDSALRERIGKVGRKTAEERFSLDRMVHELEAVYEDAIQR